jgi:T-complex protein 1 subunit delta
MKLILFAEQLDVNQLHQLKVFSPDKLGFAAQIEEVRTSCGSIVKITGLKKESKTVTVLLRGSNELMISEAERSLHDALCVIQSLCYERYLLPGGSAAEVELAVQLLKRADEIGDDIGHYM